METSILAGQQLLLVLAVRHFLLSLVPGAKPKLPNLPKPSHITSIKLGSFLEELPPPNSFAYAARGRMCCLPGDGPLHQPLPAARPHWEAPCQRRQQREERVNLAVILQRDTSDKCWRQREHRIGFWNNFCTLLLCCRHWREEMAVTISTDGFMFVHSTTE